MPAVVHGFLTLTGVCWARARACGMRELEEGLRTTSDTHSSSRIKGTRS